MLHSGWESNWLHLRLGGPPVEWIYLLPKRGFMPTNHLYRGLQALLL